jgi:hypothetical protein
MFYKVKIKKVPKAKVGYQVQGSLANDVPAMGGADYNSYMGIPDPKVKKVLQPVARKDANLEAEKGETVIGNIDGSMMPSLYTIGGQRHVNGGTPLNLPDDSFIFSDTKSMKISDPLILKMYNKPVKKGGYTPAELSKQFDMNKYRKILQDPNSDAIDRKTAELMIKTYVMKLGALALAQESKKGFPQGIPEIAKPYMEANKISEEQLIPQKHEEQGEMPQQEMGESQEMQGMEGQQEVPMQMPDGSPVAMPGSIEESVAPEQAPVQTMEEPTMEQMQEAPMAAYGMQMGGYDTYGTYAFGGNLYKAGNGVGITPYEKAKTVQGNVTPMKTDNKFSSKGQPLNEYLQSWETNIPGISKMSEGEAQKAMYEWSLQNNPDAIRNMWGTHGLTAQGMKLRDQRSLSTDSKGTFTAEQLKDPALLAKLQASYVDKKFGVRQLDPNKPPPPIIPPEGPCQCTDPTGKIGPYKPMVNGKCSCEPSTTIKTCVCTKEDGTEYDPGKDADGNCKECEEIIPPDTKYPPAPPAGPAKWWLQDTVNTMGAFGDLASIKKQMPWEAAVKLEKPRPVFEDKNRELTAQSEQAAIATDAAAGFAGGAQQLGSRTAGIQGNAAAQAANTSARVNNTNVNIANQFEGQRTGIANQESMLNSQMRGRVYDKNVIANQQFDNSKLAARGNLRQSYNTGVTNKWKTDAMNQMTPNYQVDPSSGGRVHYTPTDKTLDKTAQQETLNSFIDSIRDEPMEIQKLLIKQKYGKMGGQMFEHGGFVYTVFPAVTL